VCFIDVKQFPEDDRDITKHVGLMKNCVKKYNFNISEFIGFIV
jgi:hypothetical protein